MTVDQQGVGTGGKVSVEDFKGLLADSSRAVGYVVEDAEQFPWPHTPEEVKTFSTPSCSRRSLMRRRRTSSSWTLICQELRARNPTCTSPALNTGSAVVADVLAIMIMGPRTATKNATEWLSAVPVRFRLLELSDPQDLKSGLVLELSVAVEGGSPQPMTWPWPFGPLRETRYCGTRRRGPGGVERPQGPQAQDADRHRRDGERLRLSWRDAAAAGGGGACVQVFGLTPCYGARRAPALAAA